MDLSPAAKLLWQFLCDHCDNAGVVSLSFKIASFKIGQRIDEKHIAELGDRVYKLSGEKLLIPKFVGFQFGTLTGASNIHRSVLGLLEKHGIKYPIIIPSATHDRPIMMGPGTGKVQVQVQVQEKVLSFGKCENLFFGQTPDEQNQNGGIEEEKPKRSDNDIEDDDEVMGFWGKGVAGGGDFIKAWREWQQYRKGRASAPKDWRLMWLKQLEFLSKHSIRQAIEIINTSIRNNWQGLFEPKTPQGTADTGPKLSDLSSLPKNSLGMPMPPMV